MSGLAGMIGDAAGQGADIALLQRIAEEAGEVAARRALAGLGLDDAGAGKDMAELRELLGAWRDAKKSAVKAVAGWVVRMLLALVLVGVAVKMGFSGLLK
jgi:hypothetical protein